MSLLPVKLLSELRTEDELVILARGLGTLRLITNLLHTYDAAGKNLVILVGANDQENEWIGEALAEHYAISKTPLARGLKVINTDKATVATRQKLYTHGGILSVTSRILVVDLLARILDPETISGLVILHAEKVTAESIEAFIARIYRQYNKVGFLKAFSDVPETFTIGFNPLANRLHNLFLRKTSLWPRFQLSVAESLEGHRRAEVIEIEVSMSDKMKEIQNAVLECVGANISELKKSNSGLDMEDWTVDSALHKNFDVAIRRQLDPVWHRVSFRTKQIASDLTVLRSILHSLLTYDCVTLLKYLDTIIAAHSVPAGSNKHTQSPWLFMEASHILFSTAKARVYRGKIGKQDVTTFSGTIPDSLEPVLEEQPKWAVLADVLREIEHDIYLNPMIRGDSNGTILVMCSDQKTCRQIREYLQTMYLRVLAKKPREEEEDIFDDEKPSAEVMLRQYLRDYLTWKRVYARANANLNELHKKEPGSVPGYSSMSSATTFQNRAPPNKRRRVRGGSSVAAAPGRSANGSVQPDTAESNGEASLLEEIKAEDPEEESSVAVEDDLENMEDYYELYDMDDLLLVYPYSGDADEHILEEARPQYIIMYEPDPSFIRRVEVYRSSHTDRNVRVYFMYYGGSVEEQRYLSSVRREKDSFTKLIKEKGGMALTIVHDKSAEDPQEQFLRTVNTRIAGGGRLAATATPPTVVIDVREFRSALPSLLHGRSMIVVPCQLTVGDYVLSPDIAVERKSVRDLISSLRNGRLYNQAETMLKYYSAPILLIEFDQNKSFTFDAFTGPAGGGGNALGSVASSISPTNPRSIQHLIVLLTLAFPKLKIVWSSSPYQTAEIFEELKKNSPEPDPLRAVQIGLDFDVSDAVFNAGDGAVARDGDAGGKMVMAAASIEHRIFSQVPQDMLRTVPGVTPQALERLVVLTENIHEIANMSVDELDPIVGKESARQIVRFFTRSVFTDEALNIDKSKGST